MGTENQFIVGYSVHQRRTDAGGLIPDLQRVRELAGQLPKMIVADASYGSEENFAYVESQGRTALMKWNTFRLESTRKWKRQVKRIVAIPSSTLHGWIKATQQDPHQPFVGSGQLRPED